MPRRRLLQAAAHASILSLAGCSPRGPIKIGYLGGMSGRVADLGIGGRNGVQLAVEQQVAAGLKLELLTHDDEQNDDIARRGLTRMIDAGARFIIGPMTSGIAVATVPLINERRVPMISPTATTHELSGRSDLFFRVVPDTTRGARQQAHRVFRAGARRLVTVADLKNRAFAQSWTQAASAHFTVAGGQRLAAIDYEAAPGLNYGELAQRILAPRPDAVVIAASAADCALLVQQLRRRDPALAIALSPWAGTEQLPQMGGRPLDGTMVAQYFDRASKAPRYLSFVEQYRARFGEPPGFPAVNAYDAVSLGLAAYQRGGPDSMAATLSSLRAHEGLQRTIELDEFGDSRSPMFLTEVRDGAFVPLAEP